MLKNYSITNEGGKLCIKLLGSCIQMARWL